MTRMCGAPLEKPIETPSRPNGLTTRGEAAANTATLILTAGSTEANK